MRSALCTCGREESKFSISLRRKMSRKGIVIAVDTATQDCCHQKSELECAMTLSWILYSLPCSARLEGKGPMALTFEEKWLLIEEILQS